MNTLQVELREVVLPGKVRLLLLRRGEDLISTAKQILERAGRKA